MTLARSIFARRARGAPRVCASLAVWRKTRLARDAVRRGGQGARGSEGRERGAARSGHVSARGAKPMRPPRATWRVIAAKIACARTPRRPSKAFKAGEGRRRIRERHARVDDQDPRGRDQSERGDVRGAAMDERDRALRLRREAPRVRRHSRRAQPRGRGRGAVSRRGAHVDQGAVLEPDTRPARRSGSEPRVALRAEDITRGARSLLAQAERALNENRYDTDLPRSLAQQANYEARHAIYLAKVISTMREDNRSLEDVIPEATKSHRADRRRRGQGHSARQGRRVGQQPTSSRTSSSCASGPRRRSETRDSRNRIGDLEEEIRDLDRAARRRVAGTRPRSCSASRPIARLREQFATIENIVRARRGSRVARGQPSVVRLVGLHVPERPSDRNPVQPRLLKKVRKPRTCSRARKSSSRATPTRMATTRRTSTLSRRRAEAIGAYLTGTLGVPASRMSAVGYGETQPIASNDTPQGRERNRRIDVIIEPQLDQ